MSRYGQVGANLFGVRCITVPTSVNMQLMSLYVMYDDTGSTLFGLYRSGSRCNR